MELITFQQLHWSLGDVNSRHRRPSCPSASLDTTTVTSHPRRASDTVVPWTKELCMKSMTSSDRHGMGLVANGWLMANPWRIRGEFVR